MNLVTNKFKSGGLHEKHVMATRNLENHLNICFQRRETKKICVEVAGRRTFRILTSSQQSGIKSKNSNTHIVQQTHLR